MRRNTTLLLAGLNVLLVGLLAWLWIDPHGGLRAVHWQPPAAIRPDLGTVSAAVAARDDADVSRFMAILDRPVFSTTRRPPPPKTQVAARADPLDSIHLYGVFSGSEGGGLLVRVEGKTRRVKVSESIGDWNLKEIRGSEVVFVRGTESRVVPLVQAKQAAGAPVPRPAFSAPVPAAAPPALASPAAATPPPGTPKPAPAAGAAAKPAPRFVIGGSQ